MSAVADGLTDGAPAQFTVFRRDLRGPDVSVGTVKAKVKGDKVEAKWKYPEEDDAGEPEDAPEGYSRPEFFFVAAAEGCQARSGLLHFKDWLELEVKDEEGTLLADEECRLVLANGEVRKAKTDSRGRLRVDDVPPGKVAVELPRFPGSGTA